MQNEFAPDPRSTVFVNCDTYENFRKTALLKAKLSPLVPNEISESFNVVYRLLEFSYYEYEFNDLAVLKSILIAEMAIRMKYKEIYGSDSKKSLNYLMKILYKENHFESEVEYFLIRFREMRNYIAHPKRHDFGGPIVIFWIDHAIDLINDLFEDPILRKKRNKLKKGINWQLHNLFKEGAILEQSESRNLVFNPFCVFVNNKYAIPIYHFAFPIVDNTAKPDLRDRRINIIKVDSFEYSRDLQSIIFKAHNNETLAFLKPLKQETDKFEHESFKTLIKGNGYEYYQYDINRQIEEFFKTLRRKFHQNKNQPC